MNEQNINSQIIISEEDYLFTPYNIGLENFDSAAFSSYVSKILTLPKPVIKLVMSYPTAEYLYKLSLKYSLNINQRNDLTRILRDLLLDSLHSQDLISQLSVKLAIGQDTTERIVSDIARELLAPIKNWISVESFLPLRFPSENRVEHEQKVVPEKKETQSLHEQNISNVVDLRETK